MRYYNTFAINLITNLGEIVRVLEVVKTNDFRIIDKKVIEYEKVYGENKISVHLGGIKFTDCEISEEDI